MLVQPLSQEPVRIIGIDPGTTCMGVSVIEWGFTSPIQVVHAFTLKASNTEIPYRSIMELHGDRVARLNQLGDELAKVFIHTRPHAVIAESPYLGRFATSFAALTETLWVIRQTVQGYDPYLPLYSIDPLTAKKAVGTKLGRKTDKEDVRQALLERTDIQWTVDPRALDEHAIDATAVGLYYVLQVL